MSPRRSYQPQPVHRRIARRLPSGGVQAHPHALLPTASDAALL
jgi:hypothetical protein